MEKQFVPFPESYILNELGFNEPCFAYYGELNGGEIFLFQKKAYDTQAVGVLAPLWQQAFEWFRDKHNLHTEIRSYTAERFTFVIQRLNATIEYVHYGSYDSSYVTYAEAQLECLNKLIQILKAQQ